MVPTLSLLVIQSCVMTLEGVWLKFIEDSGCGCGLWVWAKVLQKVPDIPIPR